MLSQDGQVPWETAPELARHMQTEISKAKEKRKEVMGRMQLNVQGFSEEEEKILAAQHTHQQVSMSEDEMLGMLGEAATSAAVKKLKKSDSIHPVVGEIEAQLAGVGSVLARVEAHMKTVKLS